MNALQVGYAKVNINPPLGMGVSGYFIPRFAKGFLDDLSISSLVLSCGGSRILLASIDICHVDTVFINKYRAVIEAQTGIPQENQFISATHTHTGGFLVPPDVFETDKDMIETYAEFVAKRLIDATKLALNDLKDAKMGYIVGQAPERVAYIRRYKMKDGSTMTCPPINDPNIDHPIGTLDQRVNVLRFDRQDADTIVLVNYGLHADTINGEMLSADWPGWMCKTVEKALDGAKCIFFSGAAGDVGSTNVHPSGGDMNDTEISFDNEMKSPGMARFVGRALAGTVLQVYDKVCYVDVNKLAVLHKELFVPANLPESEELPLARKYKELHDSGQDKKIPYTGMELTTVVAEALRICKLEAGPSEFLIELTGLRLGEVAFVGIPGEPFTDIGVGIKDTEGWSMILPCGLTNGYEGYFPTKAAFDEGGYEARSSRYKAGIGEAIIAGSKELLKELQQC